MTRRPRPNTPRVPIEPLEGRRLYAGINGANGDLIRYDQALTKYQASGVTGAGQVIAVIDSGIDYTQPALGGHLGPGFKVIGGYDFVDNDADPMDTLDHGTEVAGVLAASPFVVDGVTYQGIAPAAKLVALRVDDGSDDTTVPDSKIEQALQWVIDHRTDFGITVVNISYGQGDYDDPTISSVYGAELQELHDDGVSVVAAAGNSTTDSNSEYVGANADGGINLPAADPNVISVGSVESNDIISNFSLRGPTLTMLAPGDDIVTTLLGSEGGGYGTVAGTSFASPIVAGTIALMKDVDPSLKPDDAKSILRASGVRNFDGDTEIEPQVTTTRRIYPRLDVLNALNMTKARKPGTSAQQADVGHPGNNADLAIDPQGVTHYVYFDPQAATMKYATRNTAGQWSTTQTIDTSAANMGVYLSLAVDPQGQPAVAYFDPTDSDLRYATYDGTTWHVHTADGTGAVGTYPSLIFDRNGFAAISYYRRTGADLRVARADFAGHFTTTDVATAGDVGRASSLADDSNGVLGVAFEDSTHGWLDYASLQPRGSWVVNTIDKSTHGVAYIDTQFDPETRVPWISYYDAYPANLKVAHRPGRRWTTTTVASRGATGLFSSISFAGNDDPHVLYWDKRLNALDLAVNDDDGWSVSVLKRNAGRYAIGVIDDTDGVLRYSYYVTSRGADTVDQKRV